MVFLKNLRLNPLSSEGPIDTGAEEELFRDVGRQAAAELLARRWESANSVAVGCCGKCGQELLPSICTRRQQRCGRKELPMHGGTGV